MFGKIPSLAQPSCFKGKDTGAEDSKEEDAIVEDGDKKVPTEETT